MDISKVYPVDYVVDGYKVYRKKYITKRTVPKHTTQIERVLQLKRVTLDKPKDFQFADTIGILQWVENQYGLFEFQDEEEKELFYGRINRIDENYLVIDMLHADGTIEADYDYEYELDEIRVIAFETDYHTSMCLLWKDNLPKLRISR